jgi:FG-GAP-like repeat
MGSKRTRRAGWLLGACLSAAFLSGAVGRAASVATLRFSPAINVGATDTGGAYLQEVGTADLTGDGIGDVIVTRTSPDRAVPITLLVGNGKSGFTDRTASLFDGRVPSTIWSRRTAFADFNGDGRTDVLLANTGFDRDPFPGAQSTLILSTPNGKLVDASANLPQGPAFTHSVAIADFNADGAPDIYEGNLGGPTVTVGYRVLLNDGTAHFRVAPDALPGDMTQRYAPHWDASGAADLNGDGAPDLVLLGSSSFPSRVLLNDGHAHFRELAGALPPKPWGATANGLAVTPAELNGDDQIDLLAAFTQQDPFYVGRWIQVLINNGDGTFRDETSTRLPQSDNSLGWPYSIYVTDLNRDKKLDIEVSAFSNLQATPSFYLNKGGGTFAPLAPAAFGSQPAPMFGLLDANRDGRVDAFTAVPSTGGGQEHYFLHRQLAPPKPKCKRRTKHRVCRKH